MMGPGDLDVSLLAAFNNNEMKPEIGAVNKHEPCKHAQCDVRTHVLIMFVTVFNIPCSHFNAVIAHSG